MSRRLEDWLQSYVRYAGVTEAPRLMHYFAGVAAVAGALRRKVWIDMKRYQWTPSFYIVFVAPPGIVAKSTTADIAMDLLKRVPGVKFGPDVVTWPALVSAFASAGESFPYGDEWLPMSALTLVASELGNLVIPQDREMVNLYITLWDGRKTYEKVTKTSGNDSIEAPWINMLGCTTPHWIADNMPPATVGGGFTSRCIFIYAEKKEQFVAYVDEAIRAEDDGEREALIHDLEHIALNLVGQYHLAPDARAWGREWYEDIWTNRPPEIEDTRLDGYVARKQTHLHKLAMVIAASARDELIILKEDLQMANTMLRRAEADLGKVFSRIGKTEDSTQAERFVAYVQKRGECNYADALKAVGDYFTDLRDFEGMLNMLLRAGTLTLITNGVGVKLRYTGEAAKPSADNA